MGVELTFGWPDGSARHREARPRLCDDGREPYSFDRHGERVHCGQPKEVAAMIDMHAHWRPAEVADALRGRTREPRILRNADGIEVLKAPRMGEQKLAEAFDEVSFHLARMDRQDVQTSVLSLLGSFCWIDALPPEESTALCRKVNDGLSAICQKHPGRFAAFAALPLSDMPAAAAELQRALTLPGMIGAQVPGNYFLTGKDAEAMRPLLEVANR